MENITQEQKKILELHDELELTKSLFLAVTNENDLYLESNKRLLDENKTLQAEIEQLQQTINELKTKNP